MLSVQLLTNGLHTTSLSIPTYISAPPKNPLFLGEALLPCPALPCPTSRMYVQSKYIYGYMCTVSVHRAQYSTRKKQTITITITLLLQLCLCRPYYIYILRTYSGLLGWDLLEETMLAQGYIQGPPLSV